VYKKRWYDGLHDIYEGKNEFEIKFGCFGGDGGGKGGGSKAPAPTSDPDPTPSTGFRGEQSAAANAAAEAAKAAAQADVAANLAGKSQAASDIQGKVADAVAASQTSPTTSLDTSMQNMTMSQALGLNVPTVSEQLGKKAGIPGTTVAPAVKGFQDYVSDLVATSPQGIAATDLSQAQANLNDYMSNISNQGKFSNQPTQYGFSPFAPENVSLDNLGFGVQYSGPLSFKAKGGVVQQGIGSIFPYPRRR
tara:strand:+ start:363 stop:1109 length:747 start_codon:yes stop_codon:yes gene_type:complete